MLNDDLDLDSILAIHPSRMAEFCDLHLDSASLVEMLEGWFPFSRKGLCEYLGIGESTLSGWLKEGRIPQMAKNAIVLLVMHQRLSEEVRGLRGELQAKDLKVVRADDHYQVCEFAQDEEGEVTGRLIADNIGTIEDARMLASGHRALRLAKETEPVFEYVHDMSENAGFLAQVEEIERRLEAHALYLTDFQQWKEQFGKQTASQRNERLLDDFLEQSDGVPGTSDSQRSNDERGSNHD